MHNFRELMVLLLAVAAILALAGCQSTANGYKPANCGMVGSKCTSKVSSSSMTHN